MARHRVGNSYLSDAEYTQHQAETWLAIVLLGGMLLGGLGAYFICPGNWPKWIRLVLVLAAAFLTGRLALLLNAEILWLLRACTTLFIGYQLIQFLWQLI